MHRTSYPGALYNRPLKFYGNPKVIILHRMLFKTKPLSLNKLEILMAIAL